MIYALFILFVLAVCTGLAIGVLWEAIDRWATRGADRMVDEGLADMRADDRAADTLAREKRTAELHEWQRQTRAEFEKALRGRPFAAAVRAEAEAAGLDDEWAAIQRNGWSS